MADNSPVALAAVIVVAAALWLPSVCAQDERAQKQLPAPPPMRTVPKDERNQLTETRDPKARIRRTIELTDIHLHRAEELASQHKFDAALVELGLYLGLIENSFNFLKQLNSESNKTRDLYRHIEIGLREHGPRLTAMRRGTPIEFAIRMKEAEEFARASRTEALDAFYGQTVMRESKPKKPDEENKSKDKPEKQN